MKKALIVTTVSGFLPQFVMNDVTILQEYGYEVHYASNFNNPIYSFEVSSLEAKGIVIHHIEIEKNPLKLISHIKAKNKLTEVINKAQIDLVHCHTPVGGVLARLAAAKSNRNPYVIYTAHGFHFYKHAPLKNWLLYYPVERYFAHYTDMIVTINKEDYDMAKTFRMKGANTVYQIPGVGVDMNRFNIEARDSVNKEVRAELGIPDEAFHIVTAAELNNNKDQKTVIEALSLILDDDIYYSICGKGPNKEKLQELINKHGLHERVKLLGYRTDMERVLKSADCFAFSSKREGLGVAAIEALASGVPLIVSDNRGTREYAQNDINGLVCRVGSPTDFRDAIFKLFVSQEYRQKLEKNSRESALHFSKESNNLVMREVYTQADQGRHD